MSDEASGPTVSVERPQDFHVKRSDKIPSPMNPISSLLAGRKQRVSGKEMFKSLQKRAADFHSNENARITALIQRIGTRLAQASPAFAKTAPDLRGWAAGVAQDPQQTGELLASYGQQTNNPALFQLGTTISGSIAPVDQYGQRADTAYAAGGALDNAGNVASLFATNPALKQALNAVGTVGVPGVQSLPMWSRFTVDREHLNDFLDHVDDTLNYDDLRRTVESAKQKGLTPAEMAPLQQNLATVQQQALASGGKVLKPEVAAQGGNLGDLLGVSGQLFSTALDATPTTAILNETVGQGVVDAGRAAGKFKGVVTPQEREAANMGITDPVDAKTYAYGSAIGRGALIAKVVQSAMARSVAMGMPAVAALSVVQGVRNAVNGNSDQGQAAINQRQIDNAIAREDGTPQWKQTAEALVKTLPAGFGFADPAIPAAAAADLNGSGNPDVDAAVAAHRGAKALNATKAQIYPQIAAAFAGTPVAPGVIDAITEEAAARLQNGLDPLATSNRHSEQYKTHIAGNVTSRALAQDIRGGVAAKQISPAQAGALTALAHLAPQHIGALIADPKNAAIVRGITPVQLPGLQEIDPASGKPRAVTDTTTSSWDQASQTWVDDDAAKAGVRLEHGDQQDWSPSEMVRRQAAIDADPQSQPNLLHARDAEAMAAARHKDQAAYVDQRVTSDNAWIANTRDANEIFERYAREKPGFDAAHDAYLRSKGIDPATSMANLYKGPVPAAGREISTAAVSPVTQRFGVQLTGLPQDPNRPYGQPTKPGGSTYADPNMPHTAPVGPTHQDWLVQHPVEAKRIAAIPQPVAPVVAKPAGTPKIGSLFVTTASAQGLAWWTV